ncbi:hypothetical protein NLX85_32115 [Micromonospora sp. A3M-1-15]|uniref:hypothetical protein n=1 Tax=Micromonospora sp. A3M-1-15 TaxID=2962035 RepID=UPI0020B815BF|nr:hypothetical protein [Micromonospora sp. A3M-1-15]MCP3788015.1 hypothetical protein [Micromonospora sp. A3M-1-15]
MTLAVALHPLQFALIQALEGYWGLSWLGRWLAVAGVMRHRRLAQRLLARNMDDDLAARPRPDQPPWARSWQANRSQVSYVWSSREASRLYNAYPHQAEDVMPTRLGNVLRRYEMLAGSMYGTDAITFVPRLLQVADQRDVDYVRNQRMQLELAIRSCVLGLVATAVTVIAMWTDGWHLLLALAPYLVAFLSYRGAVVLAHEYGTALAVVIELNRFSLYERLRLPVPRNLSGERRTAAQLTKLMRLDGFEVTNRYREARLSFVHPPPPNAPPPPMQTPPETDREGRRSEA